MFKIFKTMIRVRLSMLEEARVNPTAVGSDIARKVKGMGRHGFVSEFKSVVSMVHNEEVQQYDAIGLLRDNLKLKFNDNKANGIKIINFCESLETYFQYFENMNLNVDDLKFSIDWPLISKAKLTGRSPFLCSNDEYNYAYFFVEKAADWKKQLKYPLLQIYLAERFYKCDVQQVKVGVYGILDKAFDFTSFEDYKLDLALEEGKVILTDVANSFIHNSIKLL